MVVLGQLDLAHVDEEEIASLRHSVAEAELIKIRTKHVSTLGVSRSLFLEEFVLRCELQTGRDGLL